MWTLLDETFGRCPSHPLDELLLIQGSWKVPLIAQNQNLKTNRRVDSNANPEVGKQARGGHTWLISHLWTDDLTAQRLILK